MWLLPSSELESRPSFPGAQFAISSPWGHIDVRTARLSLKMESERIADRLITRFTDMVRLCESKSRRWKSPNTPNTSAPSAERRPLRDTQWASGTARHAIRPSLEELIPYRTFTIICWSELKKELLAGLRISITIHRLTITCRTPAAAAMRSTLRRLREIAEV
jgi:hypothetical protein